MKTLASLITEKRTENNMLLIRLLAASLVVIGHSFPLSPNHCSDCQDPALAIGLPIPTHGIGVILFFLISGFLITASAQKHSITQFLAARMLRIFPALIVCVIILSLLLGPTLSKLSLIEYLASERTYSYITNALSMARSIQVDLPGVTFYDGRYGRVVNGSLWTIPLEVRLYGIILFLAVMAKVLRASILLPLAIIVACATIFDLSLIIPSEDNYRLSIFFAIGCFAFIVRKYVFMHWGITAALALAWILTKDTSASATTFSIAISYITLYAAYARTIKLPRIIGDYSYGIYLYAFPIQQTASYFFPTIGPYKLMAVSLPAAWLAGAISWLAIERPALNLKKRLHLKAEQAKLQATLLDQPD